MTGILTGAKMSCVNPHLPPYTTISFSKVWTRCTKAEYWPILRLRGSWTRHRTVPSGEWLVNHANLVSAIRLPDNLFVDAGTEVSSDLIVLQKNTRKSELTEKERNFIETRLISGSININNSYADLDHIVHTSVSMGKNMYGQPAMNFIHEGGIGAISEHLRQLLAQDVENHLDRKLYDDNLSRSKRFPILKTEFEALLEIQQRQNGRRYGKKSTQPYDPMPNLFAAYADEEEAGYK